MILSSALEPLKAMGEEPDHEPRRIILKDELSGDTSIRRGRNVQHQDTVDQEIKKFRALEMAVLFRLLYSSGLRTTEARLLRTIDVDLKNGVLNIRKSKNSIEHYVALHDTMTQILVKYENRANKIYPNRNLFFPYYGTDKPFRADHITYEFHKVWNVVNKVNAVPYDLRHNYATRNINAWVSKGFSFEDKFLYLSKSI